MQSSTSKYAKKFKKVLKKAREEDDSSYADNTMGSNAGNNPIAGDWYAPGDYRVPKALGSVQTRRGTIGKRKKRKAGKRKKK